MSKAKSTSSPFSALGAMRDQLAAAEAAKKQPSRPAAPAPAKRVAAKDDVNFAKLMGDVRPLSGSKRVPAKPESEIEPSGLDEDTRETLRTLDALISVGGRFEVQDDGASLEGRRPEVPMPTLRKLRRGQFPVDARLDMHGMTAVEAKDALAMFLRVMRQKGERCVLVIHGKGGHSPGGIGVLRGEIGAWLSQGHAAAHVMAFASAHADDGGAGALYVLLRQQ